MNIPLLLTVFLVLVSFSSSSSSSSSRHFAYLPLVHYQMQPREVSPRKGVALAYGLQGDSHPRKLGASIYHVWGIDDSDIEGMSYLSHFWSYEWCTKDRSFCHDYLPDLHEFCESGGYPGSFRLSDGRAVLMFLNEPDLKTQANLSPREGAYWYNYVRSRCPSDSIALFGPKVSDYDWRCDYHALEYTDSTEMIKQNHPNWCWLREFWNEVYLLTGKRPFFDGYNVHHYYSIAWRQPNIPVSPLEPVDALLSVVSELGDEREYIPIILAEFGTCDPEYMANATATFEADSRIVAYLAWTPQRYPASACEVLFQWPFGSGRFTEVGMSFAFP